MVSAAAAAIEQQSKWFFDPGALVFGMRAWSKIGWFTKPEKGSVWCVCAERRDGTGRLAEGCNTPLNRWHGKCCSRFFTLKGIAVAQRESTPTADQSVTWDANYKHQRQANNIHIDNGIGFGSGSMFHIDSGILKQKIIIINKKCIFAVAGSPHRLQSPKFPMLLCYIYQPRNRSNDNKTGEKGESPKAVLALIWKAKIKRNQ